MTYVVETAPELFVGIDHLELHYTDSFDEVLEMLKRRYEQGCKVINLYYRKTDSYDSRKAVKK